MAPIRSYLNRRLSRRDVTVVILAVAILAALGYLAYEAITARILEARVNAAIPKVCDDIRAQRSTLIKGIEAYREHFGCYPPDHVLVRQPLVVDPATNTLFYELAGTVHDPTTRTFQAGGLEPAEEKYVKDFFQVDAFKNCSENPSNIVKFLKLEELAPRQLHDDPDVFAVGFQVLSEDIAPEILWEFEPGPWRYVVSTATNNPGKFDLWIELKVRDRTIVIGNWKAVE